MPQISAIGSPSRCSSTKSPTLNSGGIACPSSREKALMTPLRSTPIEIGPTHERKTWSTSMAFSRISLEFRSCPRALFFFCDLQPAALGGVRRIPHRSGVTHGKLLFTTRTRVLSDSVRGNQHAVLDRHPLVVRLAVMVGKRIVAIRHGRSQFYPRNMFVLYSMLTSQFSNGRNQPDLPSTATRFYKCAFNRVNSIAHDICSPTSSTAIQGIRYTNKRRMNRVARVKFRENSVPYK